MLYNKAVFVEKSIQTSWVIDNFSLLRNNFKTNKLPKQTDENNEHRKFKIKI